MSVSLSDDATAQEVRDALEERDHLRYVEVEDVSEDGLADVVVRNAANLENSLVNNGEMAAFHRLGLVVHHIDYGNEEVFLRNV